MVHIVLKNIPGFLLWLSSRDKEFDLHVAVWLKSGVLENLAPCLLDNHNRNPGMLKNIPGFLLWLSSRQGARFSSTPDLSQTAT
jgi:hypothetical protein